MYTIRYDRSTYQYVVLLDYVQVAEYHTAIEAKLHVQRGTL